MPKPTKKPAKVDTATIAPLYVFSIAVGLFIAFLMFNDIVMTIVFGVPIGLLFGLALQANVDRQKSKK